MNHAFQLSCESTVDFPFSHAAERDMSVLFYSYTVDGEVYEDDMGRDPEALPRFHQMLKDGKMPATSQINAFRYEEYFDELLQKGDVLHIAFGSGMTPSVKNAQQAAEEMREKYPDRKLIVVDSTCSSRGYGLIVDEAADRRDQGMPMEEIAAWVEANGEKVHHQFFSTDLTHFRRSGRVSGAAATVATVLGLCPLMRLDRSGHIVAYDKVRGKKNALSATLKVMKEHAQGGTDYTGRCYIGHSNCPEEAEALKALVEADFPQLKGRIDTYDIGTIIVSHCGQGTTLLCFLGDERPE